MKINREKSRKMKKLLSFSLALNIMLSLGLNATADEIDSNEIQKIYHTIKNMFVNSFLNLSENKYDKEYTDYCNNEKIIINGESYQIGDLYIEYGYIKDKKVVYLIDYHNPKQDIITRQIVDKDYIRQKVMLLKFSDVFYEYYYSDKNTPLDEYINQFEGNINYKVPETYYYNPELNRDKESQI